MESCIETDRVFNCERCVRQVRVCRRCDRGQRYCRRGCAGQSRADSLRRAGGRYQESFRGRLFHAQRQSRYRERERQKVTHHGFAEEQSSGTVGLLNEKEVDTDGRFEEGGCRDGGSWREPRPTGGVEQREIARRRDRRADRCSWCGAVGQRLVRFGYWRR